MCMYVEKDYLHANLRPASCQKKVAGDIILGTLDEQARQGRLAATGRSTQEGMKRGSSRIKLKPT